MLLGSFIILSKQVVKTQPGTLLNDLSNSPLVKELDKFTLEELKADEDFVFSKGATDEEKKKIAVGASLIGYYLKLSDLYESLRDKWVDVMKDSELTRTSDNYYDVCTKHDTLYYNFAGLNTSLVCLRVVCTAIVHELPDKHFVRENLSEFLLKLDNTVMMSRLFCGAYTRLVDKMYEIENGSSDFEGLEQLIKGLREGTTFKISQKLFEYEDIGLKNNYAKEIATEPKIKQWASKPATGTNNKKRFSENFDALLCEPYNSENKYANLKSEKLKILMGLSEQLIYDVYFKTPLNKLSLKVDDIKEIIKIIYDNIIVKGIGILNMTNQKELIDKLNKFLELKRIPGCEIGREKRISR